MNNVIQKIYPFITILLFPIFFVNRLFLDSYLFYGEERGFLNYDFVNYRYKTIWESSKNFGTISANHLNIFTTGLFWKITTFFDLNWLQSEMLFYYFIIFLTILFAFLAFRKISKKTPFSLLLSLIYITTYNYYATITTTPKLLQVLIIPMSLFFWLMFIDTKKIRYFLLNTIMLVLFLGIGINPPQMIGAYSFILIYSILFNFTRENIKYILFFYLPYVLNISFVLLLQLLVIKNFGQVYQYNAFDQTFAATQSAVYEIMRFFGAWWDYDGSGGLLYNHMALYYHSLIGIITTYIPFTLFVFLLSRQKEKAISLRNRLIILCVIILFLVKGGGIPFGELFNEAYTHIEFLKIFREPWAKFIINFIFAIYIGIAFLIESVSKNSRRVIFGILTFLFLFQLFPLAMQQVIDHRNISWKVSDVAIPEYWEDIHKWSLSNTQNKRVLILPAKLDTVGTLVENWHPFYYIGYPDEYFIYADIINSQYNDQEDAYITGNYLRSLSPSLLSLASVEYVINKQDLMQQKNEKLKYVDSVLPALDADKSQDIGGLTVYPVKKEFITPRLRIVNSIKHAQKNCTQFFSTHSKDDFISTAYVSDKISNNQELSTIQPHLTHISLTVYRIEFTNQPTTTTALFWGEAFNKGWQLYNSNGLFAQPLQIDDSHYMADCFANLWLLPQSLTNTQHSPLYLRFTPQLLYEKIKIAYGAILLVITGALFTLLRRKSYTSGIYHPHTFFVHVPRLNLASYHLLPLCSIPVLLIFDFFTPRWYSDWFVIGFSVWWLLVVCLYRLTPRLNIYIATFYFVVTILSREAKFIVLADKMGVWTVLFLLYLVFHSYMFDHLDGDPAISIPFINTLSKLPENTVQSWSSFVVKIVIILLCMYSGIVVYKNIERDFYKNSLYPIITSIEPETGGTHPKVAINGKMFTLDSGVKPIIKSNYGDIKVDSFTSSKILFQIPSKWKSGPLEIQIARKTIFEGQYVFFASEKKVITFQ